MVQAFENCTALKSVKGGANVEIVGDGAFAGCTSLRSVSLKNKLSSIEDSAFEGCTSLKSVVIPKNVKNIGDRAFFGCTSLGRITFKAVGLKTVGDEAFDNIAPYPVYKLSVSKDLKANLRNLLTEEGEEFSDKKGLGYVISSLENETVSVTLLTDEAAATATKVSIPATVKYKGISYKVTGVNDEALKGRDRIKKLTVGKNVTDIGDSAFEGCKALESTSLGKGLKNIGDDAYKDCTALKAVLIPVNVKTIGAGAFTDCSALNKVTVKASGLQSIGDGAFSGIVDTATINVSVKKTEKERVKALFTEETGITDNMTVK